MSEVSWIKIQTDMFENRKVRRIMAQKDGDSIALLWVRLLTLAGETNDGGAVYFTQNEPYTAESLSEVFGKPKELIETALDTFVKYDMIEVDQDGVIRVVGWDEYQNAEKLEKMKEQSRSSSAKWREKKKNVTGVSPSRHRNVTVTESDATDKEKEEDIEEDIDTLPYKDELIGINDVHVREGDEPKFEEIAEYIKTKGYNVDPIRFYFYYQPKSWTAKNGDYIGDRWRQVVDAWARDNPKVEEG